jgi:replicative DNA helicase
MQREKKQPIGKMQPVSIESFHAKVQPHSTDAELSVLGGIMLENRAIHRVMELVQEEDFYTEAHGIIYRAILDLNKINQPADILTVGEHLKNRGLLDAVGGFEYLSKIQDAVPTYANIEAHAKLIREKASVRACIRASMEVLSKAYAEYGDIEDFLDEAEKRIFDATHKRALSQVKSMKTAVQEAFKQIDRLSSEKSMITGVPTGFTRLDGITCGLQNSDLVIIAGRPSMGKTAFALNIAMNAYKQRKVPSVIFSLEMSVYQLMLRLLSSEAEVQATSLRVPNRISPDEFNRLTMAADYLQQAKIFLDDSAELNVMEIRSRARRLKDEHDIGLILVDYIQILRPAYTSKQESREREVAEMSRSLKALAKELNIPVVALSQLNRRPDQRDKNRRPQLSDLRESGAIEQDADLIMFLYRESAYDSSADTTSAEVIIGKNRNGPTTTLPLEFIKEYTRFNDPEGDQMDYGGETAVDGVDDVGFE